MRRRLRELSQRSAERGKAMPIRQDVSTSCRYMWLFGAGRRRRPLDVALTPQLHVRESFLWRS